MADTTYVFDDYDNSMELWENCEFNVKKLPNMRFKKYTARICGPDETYGLKRKFLWYTDCTNAFSRVFYNYGVLEDGLYETNVRYYNADDKECVSPVLSDRRYTLIWDGLYIIFNSKDLSRDEILRMSSNPQLAMETA